jgi:hypothetical protein
MDQEKATRHDALASIMAAQIGLTIAPFLKVEPKETHARLVADAFVGLMAVFGNSSGEPFMEELKRATEEAATKNWSRFPANPEWMKEVQAEAGDMEDLENGRSEPTREGRRARHDAPDDEGEATGGGDREHPDAGQDQAPPDLG